MKLRKVVDAYLTFKCSLGLRFRSEKATLHSFCKIFGGIDISGIRPELVQAFIRGHGPVTTYYRQKYRILASFYRYAIGRDFVTSSPLPTTLPKIPPPAAPYIYSTEELRRLLEASESLYADNSRLQAATYRTLLLLLYGTGMRVGEALSLTLRDVSLSNRVVTIRDGKFFKSRVVPVGPRLFAALQSYAFKRRKLPLPNGEDSAFLATRTGRRLHYGTVQKLFQRMRTRAKVCRESTARYQPRIHDIRHTASTHRIIAWYRDGADLQRLLPQLATYLGHRDMAGTQRYLSITTDLLHEAGRRFERYAQPEDCHER
jgi:site-specific recombinase XerD